MSHSASAETGQPRFLLPGLNLPLNWTPHEKYVKIKRPGFTSSSYVGSKTATKIEVPAQGDGKNLFRTALSDADVQDGATSLALLTLRELTMLDLMNALTDKQGWEDKVFDENIAQKWKTEILETEGRDVTQNMVDWVIDELRYKAKLFKETGAISVFNGDVVKSDIAIPTEIQQSLRAAIQKLEDIPEVAKDYHPGSDGKVLDLVHPSLFPLIYGRSRVLEENLVKLDECVEAIGKGKVIPIRPEEESELDHKGSNPSFINEWTDSPAPYSRNYQWLPCDVDISGDDGSVKITSYINNLPPHKHQDLYKVAEDVIYKAILLWNMTLTPLKTEYTISMYPNDPNADPQTEYLRFERIRVNTINYDQDQDLDSLPVRPEREDGEIEWRYENRLWQWELATRRVLQPDAGKFHPPTVPDNLRDQFFQPGTDILRPEKMVDLRRDYGNRGLQVIVKLANIELTPDEPEYEGGTWHVEGQLNEHICATALYYYDSENITTSRLAFRQQSSRDYANNLPYEQNNWNWLEQLFGCENGEAAVQEVGSVICREGRLITFPNILQHRVQPFKLADPTKNGHRKILALFLVDPGIRIISTANVPPQQRDWWAEEIIKQMEKSGKGFAKLSSELRDMIFEDVEEFPIGMEEAKEVRLKLMDERKAYVTTHTETAFEGNTFSLCEH